MKIKSFVLIASLAAIIFTACSSDSNEAPEVVAGVPTYATLKLDVLGVTRHYGDLNATDPEKAINTVRVYVFEATTGKYVNFADFSTTDVANNSKTFATTSGDKIFHALVNVPGTKMPVLALNSTLEQYKAAVTALGVSTMQQFEDLAANTATPSFWMSTLDDLATATLAPDVQAGDAPSSTNNAVLIKVGRLMAKIGVYATDAASNASDGAAAISKYAIFNNPISMHMIPSKDINGYTVTPFYNATPVTVSNYFPAHGDDPDATTTDGKYYDASLTAGEFTAPSYMVENSNLIPTYFNATVAIMKGTFIPAVLYDTNGNIQTTAPTTPTTFYRIYSKITEAYAPLYYSAAPTAVTVESALGLPGAVQGTDYEIRKYTNGVSYWALHLKKDASSTDSKLLRTVNRNEYWSVYISQINSCGSNTEKGSITDGGNGPDTELPDYNTFVTATMEVVEWTPAEMDEQVI